MKEYSVWDLIYIYIYIYVPHPTPHRMAYGILVPRPWIEPLPPVVEAWSLNHWTSREVHGIYFKTA